ncbi:MAG: glycosyltransferase family 39 protein [bacterium]
MSERIVKRNQGEPSLLRDVFFVLAVFLLLRGALFGIVALGQNMVPERTDIASGDFKAFPGHEFWDGWARWDSGWYSKIVEQGYSIKGPQSSVVFAPLYPAVIRAVNPIVGNHWVAGLIISNLSFIVALLIILRLARLYLNKTAARLTIVYLLIFPTSLFYSAYYSESLFLLWSSLSVYFYLKKRYFLTGLFGLFASLTRVVGIALFAAYIIGLVWQQKDKLKKITKEVLWVLLIPLGLIVFSIILHIQVGQPLAWLTYQSGWNGWDSSLVSFILSGSDGFMQIYNWQYLDIIVSAVLLVFFIFFITKLAKRQDIDKALPAYSIILVMLPFSNGSFISLARYMVVAFPTFMMLADYSQRSGIANRLILFLSSALLVVYSVLFHNWYWVG